MINQDTVFVLGAGASAPYEFFLGGELNDHIAAHLTDVNQAFHKDIAACGFTEPELTQFAAHLKKAGRETIDQFLVTQPKYRTIGKLAIVRALAPCESDRIIAPHYTKGRSIDKQRWYRHLFNQLLVSTRRGHCSLVENRLTVVTFNFDRSFERALFNFALANCVEDYDVARATELVRSIPVLHVHGQLGEPTWLTRPAPIRNERDYGALDFSPDVLRKCAESIRIYDEEITQSHVIRQAREAFERAGRICFLGFGYYSPNLEKLGIEKLLSGKTVRGTAYQMTEGPVSAVKAYFRDRNG